MNSRILIIEDNKPSARLIGTALQQEGYQVTVASNGIDGLKKAIEDTPDLVILDVMLPGLDGFEVCARLKEDPSTANLPILMLSAKGQECDLEWGSKVGADRYLVKPLDPLLILDSVDELLKEKGGCPAVGGEKIAG